jgi:hypothetical protein
MGMRSVTESATLEALAAARSTWRRRARRPVRRRTRAAAADAGLHAPAQGVSPSDLEILQVPVRDEITTAERAAKPFRTSWTVSTRRSSSSARWTSRPTTATPRNCARSSRSPVDRHSSQLEELDIEGIPAFAELILPRAADLWVQASLDQRQRFQQLFFPDGCADGIAFDGNRFVGTGATAPAFSYLRPIGGGMKFWWPKQESNRPRSSSI